MLGWLILILLLRSPLLNRFWGISIETPIPNLVIYHHEVARIPLCEVSRESWSVSAKGDPLNSWTPSLYLMVYVKFHFSYTTPVPTHRGKHPASTHITLDYFNIERCFVSCSVHFTHLWCIHSPAFVINNYQAFGSALNQQQLVGKVHLNLDRGKLFS